MLGSIEKSYRHCAEVARNSGSNFYRAFWLLGREKREGMLALYAFSRHTDDLGDSDESVDVRREQLGQWRRQLELTLQGDASDPLLPALADTISRFNIDPTLMHDLIDGVEMDLDTNRYETFAELEVYCHRVATAVGKASLAIWGADANSPTELAEHCGLALQLTNILRDLHEDMQRDRVYLPLADLQQFGYSVEDLAAGVCNDNYLAMMKFQCDRADDYFRKFQPLAEYLPADGQRVLRVMTGVYYRLLQKIKSNPTLPLAGWKGLTIGEKLSSSVWSLIGRTGIDRNP